MSEKTSQKKAEAGGTDGATARAVDGREGVSRGAQAPDSSASAPSPLPLERGARAVSDFPSWTWEQQFAMRKRREELRTKTREQAEAIMKLAGFTISHTWELANGYWPDSPDYDDVRKPWWLFLTEIGPVQIGWRKNVMHIDWSACAVRAIVTEDDVTKDERYVHAWQVEKAVEYLRTLRERATVTAPRSRDAQGSNDAQEKG